MYDIHVYIDDNKTVLNIGDRVIEAFIGLNGSTINKMEGDNKTPLGIFDIGMAFGTHNKVNTKLPYIKITKDLYWIDDIESNYYNELININDVSKDWTSAEHLIDYPKEYEYAIEIKTNPSNIKGKGSAIFIHCHGKNRYTAGCISISKEDMIYLLKKVDNNTKIYIETNKN
ncbi:MAG: L,D-transpeptidase family protein [Bacilli bacterium]|nr:L,D-transpeptidase family protein [Bacilli bacterium]